MAGVKLHPGGTENNVGTITGNYYGVEIYGGAGIVTNSGTITGTDGVGVALLLGGTVTNDQGGTIGGAAQYPFVHAQYGGAGVYISGATGTVVNAGAVTSADGFGVKLQDGGSVTNDQGGTIYGGVGRVPFSPSGYGGVYISGATATVVNAGAITSSYGIGVMLADGGTVTNTGDIKAGAVGVDMGDLGNGATVRNTGTIVGFYGVGLRGGGTVTNNKGGTIRGTFGVQIVGGAGSVTNAGTIDEVINPVTPHSAGVSLVDLMDPGTVTNNQGGTISGLSGVYINGAAGSVTNAGTISGTTASVQFSPGDGVELGDGGTVTDNQGGTISGLSGVYIKGAAGSVTNAGTISGTTGSVQFAGAGANKLTLETGSALDGAAIGSTASGATNALVLQGTGTANNSFDNFNTLSVQATGTWTLGALGGDLAIGATTLSAGTLIVADELNTTMTEAAGAVFGIANGGTLQLTGASSLAGTFSETTGATLMLTGGALVSTGSARLAGTLNGSRALYAEGTTTVAGLAICGTVELDDTRTVTQSGGNAMVGDSAGHRAILEIAATGTWDITNNFGIERGSSTTSYIGDAGLFEKTGAGTSVIAPAIVNTGAISVASGALDLKGELSGTGKVHVGGGSTLEVDGVVTAGQTFIYTANSTGDFVLDDLDVGGSQLFDGTISGFAAGDKLDAGAPFAKGTTVPFRSGTTFIYTEKSSHTAGVLALTDGKMHASINFSGNYSNSNFIATTDGHGGTLFTFHA